MATTRLADLIIPEIYNKYTADKVVTLTNLIQSGVIKRDATLDTLLSGGGSCFNFPLWNNLAEDNSNTASDDPQERLVPQKVTATNIVVPRCIRTHGWEVADIDEVLTNEDAMAYIAERDVQNRVILLQNQWLAVVKGIFANNATVTDAYHTQDDMRLDISSSAYSAGTTDFSATALINALAKLGDHMDDDFVLMVHPLVYANMKKQDLITVLQPSEVGAKPISMYGNCPVIVNSKLPCTSGVCSTYIFGKDQFKIGFGSPKVPVDYYEDKLAGNGYGITTMIVRWINAIAPNGFSFVGTIGTKSPDDTANSNMLANANSWRRVAERQNIKMLELVTREA